MAIALLAFGPFARGEFETPIAITGVTIVVEPGTTLENGTILIAGGRILAAGENVAIPSHAELIDGKGLIAYPGLIDGQTFLGIPEDKREPAVRKRAEDENPDHSQRPLPATRFANRRGIRPQFRAAALFAADSGTIKAHRASGFASALIAPRDGILSGTSAFVNLSGAPLRRCILDTDVAMHGSFRTGEEGDYPETLLGIFAQFRQVMLDATRHTKVQEFAQRHPTNAARPPVDETLDAIQPLLARSQQLFFEANSENEIRRALDLAAEFNLDVGITGAKEAWKVIDRIKAENVPLIVSLKFDDEPEYGKKKRRNVETSKRQDEAKDADEGEKPGEDESKSEKKADRKKDEKKIYEPLRARKERRRLWEEQVANTIRLHEAGIPFALRTRDLKDASKFWTNLRIVIDRGLPEDAALAALTSAPANMFGLGDRLGAIRANHIANLTLMSKPLSDKKAKVKFVFVDGRKFEIDDDDKKGGKGKRGRKHGGDEPDDESAEADSGEPDESAVAEGESESETEPTEEKDTGPKFEVELKADRIPATKTGGNVLITGATIIPVSAPTLQNASILILDGKIAKIGEVSDVPESVTVIDGTGRFVIPGFVDAHSHLGLDGVNESALAISAEVRIEDLINPQNAGIFRAVAGGTTTHHVMHGSANPIGGHNAIVKTKYGRSAAEMLIADAPPTIKFALGENVIQSNWQKAWGKRFPNTRMGVEAVIRAACEAGKAYRAEWDEYAVRVRRGEDVLPPRRDLRLEAMAGVLAGDLTVHAHCYRSDEILRLLNVAEDYGFRIGTLQHVLEGYRIAPEIARHGAGASTFSNFWAYKLEAYGAIAHNAALMTDYGINVSINSDSANTIRYFGIEAAKSIKWGGLNENQALRLVTINPAIQLQIADRVGSLEVGKDGDLAIFNGHPLNTFSKCVMTIIEGEVYFEDDHPDPVEPADSLVLPGNPDRTIPQTPHRAFAIVDATIHPISGPVIENGTVVIVEDRIHDVGQGVAIPAGAGVINGTGLHVYPGLIDASGTLGTTEIGSLRATRDYSDIAKLAPHLRSRSAVHPHSVHIRIARTAGITTALTTPSGGRISGQSAIIHLDGWTADEMIVVEQYALHMTVPSLPDRPRRFRRRAPDPKREEKAKKEHKKAVKELNEFMAKAKHYAKVKGLAAGDPEIELEIDLALEAMVPYVRGEKPVLFEANGYKHMLETIEFIEKHKLRGVLEGGTQAWKLADVLAEKNIPVIFSSTLSYPRGEFEPWDSIYRCAGDLKRAGVKFCFATSSASSAYNLGMQAGMAVAHGLPREDAEYALTLGAAEILGIADRVGSIEPGKLADLIVTTDSPLQAASQVTHMFIAGKPIELTSLHTESYEKFKNRPAPDLPPLPELVGPPDLTTR